MEKMRPITLKSILALLIATCFTTLGWADLPAGYEDPEHGEAHTHIGRNWDGIWGTSDDDKLWIGSVQTFEDGSTNSNWPNWPTLELEPQFDDFGVPILNDAGKQFYKVDEPDGWFSAHPADGTWQLGGTDEAIIPGWDISIKRVSATDGFFMLRQNDGQIVLANNGDTEDMHQVWEEWLENGSGGYGAWGCHHHISFCAWADGPGEDIFATFTAIDTGTTHFIESDPFTFHFVTVPEPMSLMLLGFGLAFMRGRSKRIRL
jgi:hypothetical protein